jgi:RNA polymerase sigma-70 factor (ECF subfamily)
MWHKQRTDIALRKTLTLRNRLHSMEPPSFMAAELSDPGSTSSSLLRRVLDASDDVAWTRLVEMYTPLVRRWIIRLGVPLSDSLDVAQEVFQGAAVGLKEFRGKREGNSFRGWLRAITRNKVADYYRRRGGQPEAVGGTDFQMRLAQFADSTEATSASTSEQSDRHFALRQLLDQIVREFQPRTWQAFWRTAIDRQSAVDVARELNMTANAVRQARFRVLRRLRQEFKVHESRFL